MFDRVSACIVPDHTVSPVRLRRMSFTVASQPQRRLFFVAPRNIFCYDEPPITGGMFRGGMDGEQNRNQYACNTAVSGA